MKKQMSIILSALILLGLLAGCREEKGMRLETPDGIIEIEDTGGLVLPLDENNTPLTMIVGSSVNNQDDLFVVQKLRQITGINLHVENYPTATVTEKVKVLIASKSMPDILGDGTGGLSQVSDLGMQGAFAAIDEYLDVMPNYKRLFIEDEESKKYMVSYRAEDGHIYAIPYHNISRDVNHGMLYRKDIFDKHGLQVWNSGEEFYQTMKKLKALYPDSTPFTSKNGTNIFQQLSVSWGIVGSMPYYDEGEKLWKYSDTDDTMKALLDYLKMMYDEKLIDPEFLTLTQAAWTTKMTQAEKAFTTFDWIDRMDMFKTQTADTVPEYDLRYAPPIGPKQTVVTLDRIYGCSVVPSGKNEELALKLMDFLLSDAGAALTTMGIRDETYEIDENGRARYLEFDPDTVMQMSDLEEKYGMFVQGMFRRVDRRSAYYTFTERQQEAQNYKKFEPKDPILAFKAEETSVINEILPALKKAASEFFMGYILGTQSSEAAWEKWKEKANNLRATELIDIYNGAQERYDIEIAE